MNLDKYANKLAKEIGEEATFWYLCNIKSAYYHKHGEYPSKSEFNSFGSKLVGAQTGPSAEAAMALNTSTKKKRKKKKEKNKDKKVLSQFNKKYKIWK